MSNTSHPIILDLFKTHNEIVDPSFDFQKLEAKMYHSDNPDNHKGESQTLREIYSDSRSEKDNTNITA